MGILLGCPLKKNTMNKQNLFLKILLCFIISSSSFSQHRNEVLSFEVIQNKVIFNLVNDAKISLKFLNSSNIKFWFSPQGKFERNNESFAVINEDFDLEDYAVNVDESQSLYEIFTGDLRVMVYKSPFKIEIYDKYQRLILGDDYDEAYTVQGNSIKTKKLLRNDEQFFGLGEKTGTFNRRGKAYSMWNSDKPCYSDTEDPLYKSIPFFMSNYNYGIFFDNTYKTTFDFGKTSDTNYSFYSPNGPFIYYFMYGKSYKEIIYSYIKLTGKPIIPPKWAFGWAQSRGMLTNEKLTREIAKEYRERNIPCDIIYQDIGWVDGLQSFEWRKDRYDNPKKMLSDLDDLGFKVIVSQDPVISKTTEKQWNEANNNGYLVLDNRTNNTYDMPWPWGGNAGVVDFTNPSVFDWWGKLQQIPINDGVKGFWTDMGEPAWSNEESSDRLHMKHYVGMHDEIHNVYGLTWDKVVTEQFEKNNPNKRVFQMTRAAYAGMQRYTFGWSGDSGNGNDILDGWRNLRNQIPLGLSAGMGLIPFWTTDISGYCGDITDYDEFSELYIRWLQFGIFNPLSRAHHEGNNAVEPWLFGKQAEHIAKQCIELKYQLHPYIYTMAREAYDTGVPIMRALILEYPNDEKLYSIDDQFMSGKDLLIAPVVKKGATKRTVYLPEGKWIDYNNLQKTYNGEQTIDYPVSLKTIPMFVKSGAIIPKMPIMQYIGEMEHAPIIFEIFPSEKSTSFELYEDDGLTNNYKNEVFSKTHIESRNTDSLLEISILEPQNNSFKTEERNYLLQIHLPSTPKRVLFNNVKLKSTKLKKINEHMNSNFKYSAFNYNPENQTLLIRIPDTKQKINISITK